ncbi:uncharacterized protein LOC143462700 [Clavelina lepadiformis]|uniref:Uncharacterized protein n=1 Tax=Clavelina lepadiformis TaxID=159417 RepID=A0ABP0FPJ0_CLALP
MVQKSEIDLNESNSLESLQKIDRELHFVLSSLSPSLEALATLAPDSQVYTFKNLVGDLKEKASKLSAENVKIKELVGKFSGNFEPPLDGLEGVNYVTFLYENKILGERLKRVLDPSCNKAIQCGIIDENLGKTTQTVSLDEVLKGYLHEKDAEREKELDDYKTLQPGEFKPGGDRMCECEIQADPLADPPYLRVGFAVAGICLACAFLCTGSLAVLSFVYN